MLYIHFGLIRELDISDSCYNCRQQQITKVYFHSHDNDGTLGFYTVLNDKFFQMFSEEYAPSCFNVAEFGSH